MGVKGKQNDLENFILTRKKPGKDLEFYRSESLGTLFSAIIKSCVKVRNSLYDPRA